MKRAPLGPNCRPGRLIVGGRAKNASPLIRQLTDVAANAEDFLLLHGASPGKDYQRMDLLREALTIVKDFQREMLCELFIRKRDPSPSVEAGLTPVKRGPGRPRKAPVSTPVRIIDGWVDDAETSANQLQSAPQGESSHLKKLLDGWDD